MRLIATLAVAGAAGCGSNASTSVPTIPVGAETSTPASVTSASPTTRPGATRTPEATPAAPPGRAIAATADSIVANGTGEPRPDPEGVAPPSPVTHITWLDARHAPRTMTLGAYLYEYSFTFDDNTRVIERTANDAAYGHPGFGYVVSHSLSGNSPLGKVTVPTVVETRILTGGHHAIHRVEVLYDRDVEDGGQGVKTPVVIEWLVATGRDHPVWAVTWKVDESTNPNGVDFDAFRMDERGPYGSLNFDGAATPAAGDAIGGVAWGDAALRFRTTDGQLSLNSPWTYNEKNTVPFASEWTANVNAEMGIVETRPGDLEMGYPDRVVGRERGATSAIAYTDARDCSGFEDPRTYRMPCVNGWPYQLVNYDWDPAGDKPIGEATGTKLVAWGSPYGWLGASKFDLFDYSGAANGRGDRSFATFIVLGPHLRTDPTTGSRVPDGDVDRTVRQVEGYAAAAISDLTHGAVVTEAPRGPGATQRKTLVNGYNDTYAAFALRADANEVAFTLSPASDLPVQHPIFIVAKYKSRSVPDIRVGGEPITVNDGTAASGAFVSIDEATDELWVTLNADLAKPTEISIAAPRDQ